MTSTSARPDRMRALSGATLARYIRFVRRTSRLVVEPDDGVARFVAETPQIIAMWHGQFLMIPAINPSDQVTTAAMVARHGDGDLIGHALAGFDMPMIRGAGAGGRQKDRGGKAAAVAAIRALRDGTNVAMTADVPPSEPRKAGPGIVLLAKHSGRPIVPIAIASRRFFAFESWSRMTLNLPFSKLALVVGTPISVRSDVTADDVDTIRQQVEDELNRVTARAYELSGGNPLKATPASALPGDAPPLPMGYRLATYRGLTRLASPAVPLFLRRRQRRGKEDPKRQGERLGYASQPRPTGRLVWFHAASIGETNAIMPVIEELLARRPSLNVVLTTSTITSSEIAKERLPERAIHQLLPVDTPGNLRRFLAHWQPDAAVLTESDLWPNMLVETAKQRVPILLSNARISQRSFRRWRKARGLAAELFSRLRIVMAQDETLAKRFRTLGARDVRVFGNLKIDTPPQPIDQAAHARLTMALGDRPVLVAASTHDGEEAAVIAAHQALSRDLDDLITIIVPRHPERGDAVGAALRDAGVTFARRSRAELPSQAHGVYLADTIGELGLFFTCANAAFIGGSLIPHGGQNPIEAVRAHCPVITGPHFANFTETYRALIAEGGARIVDDADALTEAARALLTDPAASGAAREAGQRALETLGGALRKTVDAIVEVLPEEDDGTKGAEGALKRAS